MSKTKEILKQLGKIGLVLVIGIGILFLTMIIDSKESASQLGHGGPWFTLLAIGILFLVLIFVAAKATINIFKILFDSNPEPRPKEVISDDKPVLSHLTPSAVCFIISYFIIAVVSSIEIASAGEVDFGFFFPVYTFLLLGVAVVVNIVVLVVCISNTIKAYKKKKNR